MTKYCWQSELYWHLSRPSLSFGCLGITRTNPNYNYIESHYWLSLKMFKINPFHFIMHSNQENANTFRNIFHPLHTSASDWKHVFRVLRNVWWLSIFSDLKRLFRSITRYCHNVFVLIYRIKIQGYKIKG